jgi:DNA-directed RNA polymerase specialized sigma24 family protein
MRQAVAELFESRYEALSSRARRLLRSESDAEDAV